MIWVINRRRSGNRGELSGMWQSATGARLKLSRGRDQESVWEGRGGLWVGQGNEHINHTAAERTPK